MSLPRARRWAPVVVGAALPWSWFLLRELGGRLEAVAVALPLVVAVALVLVLAIGAALRARGSLIPAASLVVFGFVTILGPRLPHTHAPIAVPARYTASTSANV